MSGCRTITATASIGPASGELITTATVTILMFDEMVVADYVPAITSSPYRRHCHGVKPMGRKRGFGIGSRTHVLRRALGMGVALGICTVIGVMAVYELWSMPSHTVSLPANDRR
jgi:hypothetical protein